MDIKPIETFYNGYRFRSRLEAKWAVFFDHANIEYLYEPEGFVLSDGTCYLHDFYLPNFHMYVEIKPQGIKVSDKMDAMKKLELMFSSEEFLSDGNGIVSALFIGDPYDDETWVYCNYSDDDYGGTGWFKFSFICGAYGEYNNKKYRFKSSVTIITVKGGMNDFVFNNSGYDANSCLINDCEIHGYCSNFDNAKAIARQSRFEHGESGYCGR